MRILAFEVREDEQAVFAAMAQEYGCKIDCQEEPLALSNVALACGYDGVTTLGRSALTAPLLDRLQQEGVRCLATRTVGYEHIDLTHARQIGLSVCHADYGPDGVADFTVMLMLMSLRHYKQALWRGQVNDYSLQGLQGREMKNLTIGVVGTGRIGRAVLRNLQGFGSRLLAFDTHTAPEVEKFARYAPLEEIYRQCDIITFHTPLLESTYHMVNAETIGRMKDGVVLINCARGELMDIEALVQGIESQKIGALGLDVVEGEVGIYHEDKRTDILQNKNMAYLRQFPNVVMTQHLAFYTDAAVENMVRCAVQGLTEMHAGISCRTQLSPATR